MGLNIVVCAKVVPKADEVRLDAKTNTLDRRGAESIVNPPDKNAMEFALDLKEKHEGNITIISMGPPFFDDYLRLLMSMGADEAVLLSDPAFSGADTYPTSLTLAEAIKKLVGVDIVICGEVSSDGGTGQVPPGIAEWLDCSQSTHARDIQYDRKEKRFRIRRQTSTGYEIISIPRPAVVSVEQGANSARFPDFEMKYELDQSYDIKVWTSNDLGLDEGMIGLPGSKTTVSELVEVEPPKRRREFVEGSVKDIASKIVDVIIENG